MTHASTFSGIGAPEIAAEMLGWDNLFHCEINPFGRAVLDYYFPNAKSYEDITKTDFSEWRGKINVLTGGFPCQPFSYAGKRRGSKDDRYLWPYMLRCIEQVQPDWFIGENVAGITTMVFPSDDVKVGSHSDLFRENYNTYKRREPYVLDEICKGLERAGYSVQPILIPACAVGAPHRRDRVWIIAHRDITTNTGSERHAPLFDGRSNDRRTRTEVDTKRQDQPLVGIGGYGTQRTITDTEDLQRDWSEFGECRRPKEIPEFGNSSSKNTPADARRIGGGTLHEHIQSELAERKIIECISRECTASDTESEQSCGHKSEQRKCDEQKPLQFRGESCKNGNNRTDTDTGNERCEQTGIEGAVEAETPSQREQNHIKRNEELLPENRWRAFPTVSPVYRGNDGLPFDVDDITIPYLKRKKKKDHFNTWKKESLKAYGNAIVVQVIYEIFRAIEELEKN